jgi:hypothetical protein
LIGGVPALQPHKKCVLPTLFAMAKALHSLAWVPLVPWPATLAVLQTAFCT